MQSGKYFLLSTTLFSVFILIAVTICSVTAQPMPARGQPARTQPSRAQRGMDYMNESRKQMMTGSESKKLLKNKSTEKDSQKISLELRNINIVDVLKILSQTGGINIVAGPSVRGNTTIFLEDVNVWDALRIILEINKLAYIQDKDILKVMTEKEYENIYGVPFQDTTETKIFKLKYANVEDINRAVSSIKSSKSKLITDERTNTLVVVETPDAMREIENLIKELDVQVQTRVYQLKYTNPDIIEDIAKDIITKKGIIQGDILTNKIIITDTKESLDFLETIIKEYDKKPYTETRTVVLNYASYEDVEPKIKELLTKEVGIVISDKRTNSLVITDYPDKINDIIKVIKSLDTQHRQVLIDCKMISVILSDDFAMGFDYSQTFESTLIGALEEQFGASTGGEQTFPAPGEIDSAGNVGVGNIIGTNGTSGGGTGFTFSFGNPDDFQIVMRLLKRLGKTKILSEPRITVMNNEEAQIQVGTDEPFVTSSTTKNSSTDTIAEDIQFIDVGVLLSVTPTINDDDYVTMKVKPEVSQVSRFVITSQSNQIPVVQTSQLETTVVVKNGTTLVLGGLIDERRIKEIDKLPILGSIPILGIPFRSTRTSMRQQELLTFLTPYIIPPEKDMKNDTLHTGVVSREFLHNLDETEDINEKKYSDYLNDEKQEKAKLKIKENALRIKQEALKLKQRLKEEKKLNKKEIK
ncbi:hypothetical protein J7L67_05140, partial [bacterium]|nr:hypothetical protein [bacterium]